MTGTGLVWAYDCTTHDCTTHCMSDVGREIKSKCVHVWTELNPAGIPFSKSLFELGTLISNVMLRITLFQGKSPHGTFRTEGIVESSNAA